MPSQISKILSSYKVALDESQERYESLYRARAQNAKKFYEDFFKSLIKSYYQKLKDPAGRRQIKRDLETFFGTNEIRFAAIDGTSYRERMGDYVIFFGASYGVRGSVSFEGEPPKIRYERWSSEQDVSMVAYVPVPFAELSDVSDSQFVASDDERIDLSFIHNQIMQLAEIFLAYDFVSSSSIRPKLLLWDQSMSGVMASTDIGVENIPLVGFTYLGRQLTIGDLIIAYSHPYNEELQIPSYKKFRLYNYVLSQLWKKSPIIVSELAKSISISRENLLKKIKKIIDEEVVIYNQSDDKLSKSTFYNESWEFVKQLFRHICTRLFKDKDQKALIYEKTENGETYERWMSPNDLRFLIAVGMRALIEECWRNEVLLIGISKDSTSQYLSRNYLGVLRHLEVYDFQDTALPWTDRSFLEILPLIDDQLQSPWTAVEFDSAFMTLRLKRSENPLSPIIIGGVKGSVVNQERLFLRSLAQFYLNRSKRVPLMGHVIFIDRLAMPRLDRESWGEIRISEEELGEIHPIIYEDSNSNNRAQDISMILLDTLTRNLFPEVIGYPDPLHKADWGAKSLEDKVKEIIKSSGASLRARPLTRTFRDIRDSYRRI